MWPLLLLIIAANGAPVLVSRLLRGRWRTPLDLRVRLADGRRLLGASKTWRGLLAALLVSAALAPLLGLSLGVGLAAGALAMAGDLLSSFAKRRLGLAPSSRVPLLDTVPEALLPGLGLMLPLGLDATDLLLLVILFTVFDMLASPLLYWLHIRRQPW
ncbi:MAG: CDP-archaeol synthase [Thiohalocapsa sp.]|uniref:CDP-archaeol synthase n=1 Tax=Thiohalocapsa sp. TaxID=2497641 RepID=UPI0025E6B615|nr:CDP-archaeol synthase [Thiohalocapsa sp.]MCG6941371.1 CDP-archaeol synthase [Thiohalocapsa sp.]